MLITHRADFFLLKAITHHGNKKILTTLCTKRTALPDSSYEVMECLINIGFLFCTRLNVLNLLKTKRI